MKINEVIGIDNDFDEIKNIIMFLKSKGIMEVPIKAVSRELSRRGLKFTVNELIPIVSDLPIVSDVNNYMISLNGKDNAESDTEGNDIPDKDSDEGFDMNKEKVKQMARSSRIRRDR